MKGNWPSGPPFVGPLSVSVQVRRSLVCLSSALSFMERGERYCDVRSDDRCKIERMRNAESEVRELIGQTQAVVADTETSFANLTTCIIPSSTGKLQTEITVAHGLPAGVPLHVNKRPTIVGHCRSPGATTRLCGRCGAPDFSRAD